METRHVLYSTVYTTQQPHCVGFGGAHHIREDRGSARKMLKALVRVCLVLSLTALPADASQAAVCAETGEPAPPAVTLMASKIRPAVDAWIISPTCDLRAISVSAGSLYLSGMGIERVESVPTSLVSIALGYNPLTSANFTGANQLNWITLSHTPPDLVNAVAFPSSLRKLDLSFSPITSLEKLDFPVLLESLDLRETALESVDNVQFPPYLLDLQIGSPYITSLKNAKFPSTLKTLTLETASGFDFVLPSRLVSLTVNKPVHVIEGFKLPNSLRAIDFRGTNLAVIKGVKWPSALQEIQWDLDEVFIFEIRQSDVPIFERMQYPAPVTMNNSMCTYPAGQMKVINTWRVCVIPDEDFAEIYEGSDDPTPSPSPSSNPSASGSGSESSHSSFDADPTEGSLDSLGSLDSGSIDDGGVEDIVIPARGKSTRKPTSRSPGISKTSPPSVSSSGSRYGGETETNSTRRPSRQSNSTKAGTQSAMKSRAPAANSDETEIIQVTKPMKTAMVIAAVIAGIVLVLMVVGLGVRAALSASVARKRKEDDYEPLDTPRALATVEPSTVSTSSGTTSIANTELLLALRVSQKHIHLKERISCQGFSEVFHASYNGQDVAVKRIQAGYNSDPQITEAFEREVVMCASLRHPKIVALVGAAWTTQEDLSVIVELMARGDLETLLYSQSELPTGRDWTSPWASSHIKSKTSIALDVAEALLYLHTLSAPIPHRDVRTCNVLLDSTGNAKLNAFAISRNTSADKTVHGGIGSVSWIAPEVLLGEEPTEKSDIYAFGVLLVELDRCRHPFSTDQAADDGEAVALTDVQIAVQVSAGELRPTVSSSCPEPIAGLVSMCLQFNAAGRPSSKELVDEIQKIQKALGQ